MSKKHYIAVANILAGQFVTALPSQKAVIWDITLSLADIFKQDNVRFDRARFYEAVFGNSDHFAVRNSFTK